MERIYLEKVLDNALLLEGEWDYVVIHDPQPAAMLELRRASASASRRDDTKWIWRCHIDLTDANPTGVGVLPAVRRAVRRVGVDDAGVRARLARHGRASCIAPPCIDPLSVKNLELPHAVRARRSPSSTASTSEPPDRVPGEPLRPVEGPGRRDRGVPHRARASSRRAARARGLDGHRRPRGLPRLGADRRGRAPATATSTCCRTSSRSAPCRSTRSSASADVVMQKSLREGFGLTVSEGLWKGRPVDRRARRRHHAADPTTASTATSSTRSRSAPQRTIDLLADPAGADEMGAAGREHVREQLPLDPRARRLAAPLRELRCGTVIVVSHRGPVPVRGATTTGSFAPQRGAGGVVERARAAGAARRHRRTTIVDRGGDRRRRPRRGRGGRGHRDLGHRPAPARPRSRAAPHALRRHRRTACCGSCSTACSTSPADPASTVHFREAWEALRGGQRRVRRRRSRRRAPEGEHRARARLPARARPGHAARRSGPTCASCTSRTRRSAVPTRSRVLPDRRRPRRSARRWRRCRPGSTPSGGPTAYRQSARDGARPRASIAPPFAAQPRARSPTRSAELAAGRRRARRGRRARRRWSATALLSAQRPHRAVEEHRARLPRVRRAARRPPGLRGRVVFVAMLNRVALEPGRVPRVRAARSSRPSARVNERWATRDWQPIVARRPRRLRAIGRRVARATTCCS